MKFIYTIALVLLPFISFSQSIVSLHQSPNSIQASYAYEFSDKYRAEIRIYPNHLIRDMPIKLMFTVDWIEKDIYEFYSGVSLWPLNNQRSFLGLPIGLNLYPFENKNFGFLMELSPHFITRYGGQAIFTGSWGIRYRFNKKEK